MTKLIWCLLLTALLPIQTLSLNDPNLDKLDSLAFAALENNDTTVFSFAKELLTASQKTGPNIYVINAHTILGIYNKERGYFETSISHYLLALEASEKIDDKKRISACYNNIGSVYQIQGNYKIAKQYFQKSLALEKKLNQPLQRSIRYYNIGDIYRIQDSLDLALNYFNQSLIIERKYNNKIGEVYALIGISEVYGHLGRISDADYTIAKIDELDIRPPLEPKILFIKLKAQIYFLKNNIPLALSSLKKAERICLENKLDIYLLDIYKDQITLYESTNDWKNSTKYYQKYLRLNKSLNDIKIQNRVNDLVYQNELNRRNIELKLIQEERDIALKNEQNTKKTEKYSNRIILFLVISIIISVFSVIVVIKKNKNVGINK